MVMLQKNVNFKISTKMVRSNEYFAMIRLLSTKNERHFGPIKTPDPPMTSFMTFISVKFDIGTKNAFEG